MVLTIAGRPLHLAVSKQPFLGCASFLSSTRLGHGARVARAQPTRDGHVWTVGRFPGSNYFPVRWHSNTTSVLQRFCTLVGYIVQLTALPPHFPIRSFAAWKKKTQQPYSTSLGFFSKANLTHSLMAELLEHVHLEFAVGCTERDVCTVAIVSLTIGTDVSHPTCFRICRLLMSGRLFFEFSVQSSCFWKFPVISPK